MTRSIRASLIAGTVIAAVASIAIGGAMIYGGARSSLLREFDDELEEDARMLASTIRVGPAGLELGFDELDMRDFAPGSGSYLQVSAADSVLYRSSDLGGGGLEGAEAAGGVACAWTRVNGESRVRVVTLRFQPKGEGLDDARAQSGQLQVRLDVARKTASVDDLLRRLRVLLALSGLLAGAVAAVVIAGVVRRSLRPLDRLASEISHLGDDGLGTTVRLADTPAEVEPVLRQLNGLLRRLDAAFLRERTFSADIAHELRTPLAGLRSTIEVTISRSRTARELEETLRESLTVVTRMQSMVETLLYLARLEAGQVPTERISVDMGELVAAAWQPLEEAAARKGIDLRWRVAAGTRATADPLLAELALRNLLDNAVSYVDPGGTVEVALNTAGGLCVVTIRNGGSNVAQESVAGLMARFSRSDASRGTAEAHYGLGLALVAKIAAVLNSSLDIRTRVGGDFVVTMALPVSPLESGARLGIGPARPSES